MLLAVSSPFRKRNTQNGHPRWEDPELQAEIGKRQFRKTWLQVSEAKYTGLSVNLISLARSQI